MRKTQVLRIDNVIEKQNRIIIKNIDLKSIFKYYYNFERIKNIYLFVKIFNNYIDIISFYFMFVYNIQYLFNYFFYSYKNKNKHIDTAI